MTWFNPKWIECPQCKQTVRITKDGLIAKHTRFNNHCSGSFGPSMVPCELSRAVYSEHVGKVND